MQVVLGSGLALYVRKAEGPDRICPACGFFWMQHAVRKRPLLKKVAVRLLISSKKKFSPEQIGAKGRRAAARPRGVFCFRLV